MEAKTEINNQHMKFSDADTDAGQCMPAKLVQCPSCAQHLKPHEVSKHCVEEMDRLQHMEMADTLASNNDCSSEAPAANDNDERLKPYTVFQKVQRNRYLRLKRTRKRPVSVAVTSTPERACPVCNKSFAQDDIEQHVEECLRRSKRVNGQNDNNNNTSDEDEGSEEYEEYEWAGQKRIRVSSLLQGGYAAHGIGQLITNGNGNGNGNGRQEGGGTDEDEDLNVDEDDTHIYGPPQYAENDIISPGMECNDDNNAENVTSYMRKLISNDGRLKDQKSNEKTTSADTNTEITEAATSSNACLMKKHVQRDQSLTVYEQIIDSLKAKLRVCENQQLNKYKCLICLDEYRKPAISVSCWHVHCEDCWLRSLGTRKLCPQCNLITTPKDLRRIYM